METRRFAEYEISRLMLGTVQFGIPYGVANRTGQPDYAQVLAMMEAAIEGGVNCFDTAAAYGSSEDVLGRALHELRVADQVVVVTKVRALTPVEQADAVLAAQAIEWSVSESRRRLQLDCLPVVMFHNESDAIHLSVLERLKAKGWLKHIGVSCGNTPGPAATFAALPSLGALQIPANVLDPRHEKAGSFAAAAGRGVAVFVRSIYLQGLLVMPENEIPEELRSVVPTRRALAAIAGDAGITLTELAVRAMLGKPGVTCLLAGVDTVDQMRENVALFSRGPLGADLMGAIDDVVPDLPAMVLSPALWPPRQPVSIKGKRG